MCCHVEPSLIETLSKSIITPIAVSAITYFAFGKVDELRKRRNQSKLGASILHTLAEEVKNGRDFIRKTLDPTNTEPPHHLPRKSWLGINTINDEVLLRILAVTKGVTDVGFPAFEIRIHTKNYFDHMTPNWDKVCENANPKTYATAECSTYDAAATGVLDMLNHIEKLLDDNSTKMFPK